MQNNILQIENDEFFEHFHFSIDGGKTPERIDKFLSEKIHNISRTKIQNAAKAGNILVNNTPVKANYKIKPNDEISIVFAFPPSDKTIVAENIPINIVYEDDYVLLINKPAGMVVHPGVGNYSGTLINALMYHFKNLPNANAYEYRPGLIHRLDKNTSGVLVIAKNEVALEFLSKELYHRKFERRYHALVWGDVKEDSGTITGHIGRSLKDRKIMQVFTDQEQGKHAVTHYKVLKRYQYITLVECKLETGRTHQIRIHMKHIGHPLFNDVEYGGNLILRGVPSQKFKQFIQNCFDLIPGQALHAKSLGFIHPENKQFVNFDTPLPDGYAKIIEKWEKAVF